MMIAMIRSSNSNSGTDSDSSLPPQPKSTIKSTAIKNQTKTKHQSTFETKLTNLKNRNPVRRSLPITSTSSTKISPFFISITTPQLPEDYFFPLLNCNLHINSQDNLSPH